MTFDEYIQGIPERERNYFRDILRPLPDQEKRILWKLIKYVDKNYNVLVEYDPSLHLLVHHRLISTNFVHGAYRSYSVLPEAPYLMRRMVKWIRSNPIALPEIPKMIPPEKLF